MNILIKICDILASSLTVISLFLVAKSYKYWLLYIVSSLFFITVCAYNKIPGLTIMGICLLFIGINNYRIGRKNEKLSISN